MKLRFDVRARPSAAAEARRALERLTGELGRERLETLKLLVTELVTNSVRHCPVEGDGWRIGVTVEGRGEITHVRVSDPGRGFRRRVSPPSPFDVSGRGLFLVDRLALAWGIDDDEGTCVWFDLGVGVAEAARR